MRNLILIISMFGLFTCSNSSKEKSLDKVANSNQSAEIIWIEVTDSLSNFEALLSTNHLYYLRHMSVNYDNYGVNFWKSVDTTMNNDWILKRFRKGACPNSSDTSQVQFCIEQQEHTINKKIGKVIKFSGNGSGYFATIEFIYNDSGRLTEYKDFDKTFYLRYDDKNDLEEVLKTEITHGIKKETGLIKFKKTTDNNG